MPDEKIKLHFEPGCFDDLDMTQEELDSLVDEIKQMAESGELFKNSVMITEDNIDELPEDIQEQLMEMLVNKNERIVH